MIQLPKHVFNSIWRGRAVLIAGQDLVRGDTEELVKEDGPSLTLGEELLRPRPHFQTKVTALRQAPPSSAHVEVAQLPWALVISSALDTRLDSALEAAAPAARRVRRRYVDEPDADILARSPTVLEVMHLSLFSSPTSPDGAVPEPGKWTRASRLLQPRVLERLRDAIGPAFYVVIDGVTHADALDRENLLVSLEGIDDAQIVLCDPREDETSWLRDSRPGVLALFETLPALLRTARAEAPLELPELLRAEDLAITVRSAQNGERRIVIFRAEELRDIRRHVEIVGDAPGRPAPKLRDERVRAFSAFLRTPRLRADYQSFVPDFCLQREAYGALYDAVMARIVRVSGMGGRQGNRRSDGPILLKGFPGSGRTTGLHWLGVRLRMEGWPVAHLSLPIDEPDPFAIEQIMRLAEQRLKESGAIDLVVLLVDGVARDSVERLEERLIRAGRRTIVVATAILSRGSIDLEEEDLVGAEIPLEYQLTSKELNDLDVLLREIGIMVTTDLLVREAGTEGFLGMLDRLSVDAREGLAQVLRTDFNRFIPDLARALRARPAGVQRGALGEAIMAALAQSGRTVAIDGQISTPTPTNDQIEEARGLMRAIFAFAWLDRAMPLDLLGRRFPKLFSAYEDVRIVAQDHGFLTEITLDDDEDIAFAIVNPAIARALRRYVLGSTRDVLRELRAFAEFDSVAHRTGRQRSHPLAGFSPWAATVSKSSWSIPWGVRRRGRSSAARRNIVKSPQDERCAITANVDVGGDRAARVGGKRYPAPSKGRGDTQ